MPVLEKIELYFVSAPLPAPFSPSWVPGFTRTKFAFYLIRLITADGIEGWNAFPGAGRERAGISDGLAESSPGCHYINYSISISLVT